MKDVLVLLHQSDLNFASGTPGYLLELLMSEWKRNGIDVLTTRGTDCFPAARVLIPHLDLTVIPHDYLTAMHDHAFVVNGRVRDTSKSRISTNLLQETSDYLGPVIVKTDMNYGGLPEANLHVGAGEHRHDIVALVRKAATQIVRKALRPSPWKYVECIAPGEYPVFPSLGEVPKGIFENDRLVVERYIPEKDGDDYLLRYYYFLGDRETCLLLRSKERVVKFSNAFHIEEIEVHPDLRKIRENFGFDFGKFDYFVHDDKAVVFDVNKTPGHTAGHGGGKHEQLYSEMVSHLAGGIDSLLDASRDASARSQDDFPD